MEVAPENPVVNLQMAKAYLVGEETEKAKLKYQKALDLAPTFVEALVGLGNIYQFEGSFELAIDHYEKALTLNPDLEGVRQNLWESYLRDVQAYKEVGDFTTAFEKLDRARVYNRREADEQIVILCSEAPSYCL